MGQCVDWIGGSVKRGELLLTAQVLCLKRDVFGFQNGSTCQLSKASEGGSCCPVLTVCIVKMGSFEPVLNQGMADWALLLAEGLAQVLAHVANE